MTELEERRKHHECQMALLELEKNELDRVITSSTVLFFKEIEPIFAEDDIEITIENGININQFLYLINANYYKEISKTLTKSRETIIKMLIYQIRNYLLLCDKRTFDENDAKAVLKSCFFLSKDLQKAIGEEFARSRVDEGANKYFFGIIRKNLEPTEDDYFIQRRLDVGDRIEHFDISNPENIGTLICLSIMGSNIGDFLDIDTISFASDTISRILTSLSTKFRNDMLEYHHDYSNYAFASSYIEAAFNLMAINGFCNLDEPHIISAFKHWNYVPFSLKLEMLDSIFEEENLSYELHPFRIKEPENKPQTTKTKIISFRSNENKD